MKKTLTFFSSVLLTLAAANAEAPKYDILISAAHFKISPDLRQIVLYSPTVNLKNEKENTHLKSLSVNEFINLWRTSPQDKKSFAASPPNAILTSWNKEKNYLETSFIIQKTSIDGNKLVLDVKYLEEEKAANNLPIRINTHPATKKDLQKYLGSLQQGTSVSIIVDNPWNPHGGPH